MATYLELKEQAEKLMAEAESLRRKETDDVISEIKQKMREFGLTAEDLGVQPGRTKRKSKGKTAAGAAKYKGPNGELWSGGRGRKPAWVVHVLKEGRNIEDFAAQAWDLAQP